MRGVLFAAFALALAFSLLERFDAPPPPLLIGGQARAAALGPAVALYSSEDPPARFRANTRARIRFMDEAAIGRACGDEGFGSCASIGPLRRPWLVMPNPCGIPESYAKRLCHELGHVNGWPRLHGP
jgi:hypothetical protein